MWTNNKIKKYITTRFPDGHLTSSNRWNFTCPKCRHDKSKAYVDLGGGSAICFHCNWKCHDWMGTIASIEHLGSPAQAEKWLDEHYSKLDEFEYELPLTNLARARKMSQVLPREFEPFRDEDDYYTGPTEQDCVEYIKSRGFTYETALRYRMGFCNSGKYARRIIIPIYEKDELVFFFDRAVDKEAPMKTLGIGDKTNKWSIPKSSVIWNIDEPGIQEMDEVHIAEGIFSALSLPWGYSVALLGKQCSGVQLAKLLSLNVSTYYLALDPGTDKETAQLAYELHKWGKTVKIHYLTEGDPNDLLMQKKPLPTPVEFGMNQIIEASMCGYIKET